ncbi:DUF4393 domain-containing protein [Psychrobacillus vulpis]|uniref:DUF4393 domain-containing protein n=1 Tax=Psychrobacillus vulpis TaxID=2325572 RepID=A0A544TWF9_9BACI|nr:DUF4393 domain-containing protein [Psychrobacillus vulpis]TQR21786.1 DUF4393 domain-containing protein [Psychrobacillus vulpis]
MSNVKDTLETVQGIMDAVPVYEDMLQPASKELGKGLLTISKTVNIALAPLAGLVWGYEKISSYLENSMAGKLKDVPEERIITPDPSVAVPTIEALRYTAHKEELRELFSNLIATAMDKDVAIKAHPSFVEIIKQLTPDEAKIICSIKDNGLNPLIGVQAVNESNGFLEIKKNFTNLSRIVGCSYPEMVSSYIENLNRLGLISIDTQTTIAENSYYDELINQPEIQLLTPQILSMPRKVKYQKYTFSRTEFGEKFVNSCTRP